MPRIRRILVAVKNPSAKNSPAVIKGAQLARALNAELILFHAISAPLYVDGDLTLLGGGLADVESTTRNTCLERLEAIAQRLRDGIRKVTVSAQWDYPIYEAVIREATRSGSNLIVAERHTGWHTPRSLLRLTDWELLRLSPVPVLLVKGGVGAYRRPIVLAAVDPDHSYAKPQRLDRAILRIGSTVAVALRGTLHAVHAYVPISTEVYAHGTTVEDIARMRTRTTRDASKKLQQCTHFVALPRSRLHVIGRHPPDAIEQAAVETHCSMVVMGAISRRGLNRFLFGNTAEKVLDHLPCDVLVVKPAHLVKPLPRVRRGVRYVYDPDMYVLK
jgi:universal stress protein E